MLLLIIMFLVSGCATKNISHKQLLASLNVGVQSTNKFTPLIAQSIFYKNNEDSDILLNHLSYVSEEELQRGFEEGRYDIVVGVLEIFSESFLQNDREFVALKKMPMPYFVLSNKKELRLVDSEKKFFAQTKSIGYVSEGINEVLNTAIFKYHPRSYQFIPCGDISDCSSLLQKKQIESFTTGLLPKNVWHQYILENQPQWQSTEFIEYRSLGLMINTLSLHSSEIQQLMSWLFKQRNKIDFVLNNQHINSQKKQSLYSIRLSQ